MIRSSLLAAGLLLAMVGAASAAEPNVEAMAGGCRADSAWGFKFGDKITGSTHLGVTEQWGVPVSVDLDKTPRSEKLVSVLAIASYERDPGTFETRSASAAQLFEKIEAAIAADGRFTGREVSEDDENDVTYSLQDAAGETVVEFSVRLGGVGVWMNCENTDLQQLRVDEALGRTRVDKPEPPTLPLPARPEPGVCADPARRDAFVASFSAASMKALEYSQAGSRYSEHLAQWKGQQLIDKGVWTKQRAEAFALTAISDPIIGPEFEAQMKRLMPMLEHLMAFSEAQDSNPAMACAEALKTLDIVQAMTASNERQWKRMHDLYDAEARRLKVTLD